VKRQDLPKDFLKTAFYDSRYGAGTGTETETIVSRLWEIHVRRDVHPGTGFFPSWIRESEHRSRTTDYGPRFQSDSFLQRLSRCPLKLISKFYLLTNKGTFTSVFINIITTKFNSLPDDGKDPEFYFQ
jgi:hypothetical protein